MKKIHLSIPVPTKRDITTVRDKTVDITRLTGSKLGSLKRKTGRFLIRQGHKLAAVPHRTY